MVGYRIVAQHMALMLQRQQWQQQWRQQQQQQHSSTEAYGNDPAISIAMHRSGAYSLKFLFGAFQYDHLMDCNPVQNEAQQGHFERSARSSLCLKLLLLSDSSSVTRTELCGTINNRDPLLAVITLLSVFDHCQSWQIVFHHPSSFMSVVLFVKYKLFPNSTYITTTNLY